MAKTEKAGPILGLAPKLKSAVKAPEKAETYLIPVLKGTDGLELPSTNLVGGKQLREVFDTLSALGATGKSGEVTRVPAPAKSPAHVIVAVGLGDPEEISAETVRRAAGSAARALSGAGHVATTLGDFGLTAAVEGIMLGGYVHRGNKTDKLKSQDKPANFTFLIGSTDEDKAAFNTGVINAEGTILARDLVNTPANFLYPESYANFIAKHAKGTDVKVDILDEKELEKQGFGGIMSVGKASQRPPRLVRLTYKSGKKAKNVALVGKGITFDTGGISLKPGAGMWDMISDMGGSAAVAGATFAAAKLGLDVNITTYLPLAENMPDGGATRPGDVVTHYGGITSEVLNTDAEGRMVLGDAMALASEAKPDYLIETATLTGAQLVALGKRTAGVMGSEDFRDRVAKLGREVGENAWAMPLLEEHEESIKSPVADIRNIDGNREGGMEYAGTYLSKFVGEGIEWVHIDVAGPAWNGGSPYGYNVKRATGAPVRTILATLADIAAESGKERK
ncbi:aminopeptidase A [Corynebacterium phocae]|uniref:Probable cytosol aminopeptidase n=1 Tax=Corynebacterium phocae TaxID=161895 RepID=A0A1L7D259_9CORY|nr:leucyl aminopeptidase [Corynebacterium phocae]APT92198.1 aminopeptidase A [Corynebacterium phocae]